MVSILHSSFRKKDLLKFAIWYTKLLITNNSTKKKIGVIPIF